MCGGPATERRQRSDEEKVQESGGLIWGNDERQGRRVKFDLNFCACFSPVTKKGGRKLERRCRLVAGVKEFDAPLFRSRYIFFLSAPKSEVRSKKKKRYHHNMLY